MTVAKTTVVLLIPEAMSLEPGQKLLPVPAEGTVIRLLVRLTEPLPAHLQKALTATGAPLQFLTGPGLAAPGRSGHAQMPRGTTARELDDFAMMLADAVLAQPSAADLPLLRHAAALGKPIIGPGETLAPPLAWDDIMLDPERRCWYAYGKCGFGRLEQGLLGLLAFNWLGGKKGARQSYQQLKRCISTSWGPGVYFVSEADCCERNLDQAALDPRAPIISGFAALNRSAVYGSYIHRDLIWITQLGAAFAVFAAVVGALSRGHLFWGVIESYTLLAILFLTIAARITRLQGRWTACRLGGEQLRIARMCLPLFVVPPALASIDRTSTTGLDDPSKDDFSFKALAEVKRAVREQGVPCLGAAYSPVTAARWLQLIVNDQIAYHNRNHKMLEHAELTLNYFTGCLFFAALVAAVMQFFQAAEWKWLLVVTAVGPALLAATHGAGTRLGIVHRIALSRDIELELRPIGAALATFIARSPVSDEAWIQLRRLARQAADAMGRESTSWHSLVRRHTDALP
jgi:hypothetical protein